MIATVPARSPLANRDTPAFLESEMSERTPWLLGFLCLLFPILPIYLIPPGPLRGNAAPAQVIVYATCSLLVLEFLLLRRTSKTRTFNPGVVFILLFFLLLLLSWGMGQTFTTTIFKIDKPQWYGVLYFWTYAGIALYVITRIKTYGQRSMILGCLAIGLTYNALIGILQNLANIDLHLLLQPPGFIDGQVDLGRGVGAQLSERYGAKRAFGTAGHPIEFSVLAAVTVPLNLHFSRYASNKNIRMLAAVGALIGLVGMLAGGSRSGVLSLTAACLLYMWGSKIRSLALLVLAGTVGILFEAVIAPRNVKAIWTTITNASEDGSVLSRVAAYERVSQAFHQSPIFGLGFGTGAAQPQDFGYLDNQWLGIIVTAGAVGLVGMAFFAAGGIFGVAAALRGAGRTPRAQDQAYTVGAMWLGILASSFSFDVFAFRQVSLLFFLLYGLLWSFFTLHVEDVNHKVQNRPGPSPAPTG